MKRNYPEPGMYTYNENNMEITRNKKNIQGNLHPRSGNHLKITSEGDREKEKCECILCDMLDALPCLATFLRSKQRKTTNVHHNKYLWEDSKP